MINHNQGTHPHFGLIIRVHVSMIKHSVFLQWLDCLYKCFSYCSPFIMLCNGLKMSEYEAYWITDFLLITNLGACIERIMLISFYFKVVSTSYKKANKRV